MPETQAVSELREMIVSAVESERCIAEDIAVALFERPETGLMEVFASEELQGILASRGFQVKSGLAGLPTAFLAQAGTSGPTIAFMAEYDALPGIGHGCGHNLIAAAAVAAGIACKEVMPPDETGVTWIVLGTPAEETIGGKVQMVEAGVFEGIDAAFIAHPGQRNSVGEGGISWASWPLEMVFHGRSAHAGGNPQEGRNALDAAVTAYTTIRNLRNSLRDEVRLAGIVSHGGEAQNIVPDRARLRFTLRSTDSKYLETEIVPRVKLCAEGAAMAHRVTVEFNHHEPMFRETLEYPALRELARKNFEYLGQRVPPPGQGGGGVTDVGNVTWVTPCIQIGFDMTEARGHSREMALSTVTPRGIQGALTAAKVLALCAADLICDPGILLECKEHLLKQGLQENPG